MRRLPFVAIALLIAGCYSVPPIPELSAEGKANEQAMIAACNAKPMHAADRERCYHDVDTLYVRPFYPFPDLWDTMWQKRIAIADEFDRGMITGEQAKAQIAQANDDAYAAGMNRIAVHHIMNE